MAFKSLHIIEPILKSLSEEGYTIPTPIQAKAIPIILQGTDLLGCAQTGTGKTAAFAIPILQLLSAQKLPQQKKPIRSLIVTPTRELAIQINDSFKAYGRHTGLTSTVIFGGVGQQQQTNALQRGVDILIATPGRLLDLMSQKYVSLKDIQIFVLDEADRMLDMGFIHDVKKIIHALPQKRQSLFFSATMPAEIVKLSGTILHNPEEVTVTPVSSTVDIINQHMMFVDKGNKGALLLHLLKDTSIKTALVFTRTKHGADKVVKLLLKNNIKAEAIHGNKAQNARQRALANFKAQSTRVLVATDIASRGIDVDDMEFVINYEIPNIAETYVHRIGRTGRAGAKGTAYSFCDAEEKEYLRDIEKLIGKKIPVVEDHPYPLTNHHPVKAPKQEQHRQQRPQRTSHTARPGHTSRPSNTSRPGTASNSGHSGRTGTSSSSGQSTRTEHSGRPGQKSQSTHATHSRSTGQKRPSTSSTKSSSSSKSRSHSTGSSEQQTQTKPKAAPAKKSWFDRFRFSK
uniref:RNA helicase n=1 Tax=uncultured bacterium pAM1 TaxID=1781153 RepID=A0A1C9U4X4_9BACT|nr:DEAD/DEAH box helicase [uncultured bacterium pAM1]